MKAPLIQSKAHCGMEIDSSKILKKKNLVLYFFPKILYDNVNILSQEAYLFKNYLVRLDDTYNEVVGITDEDKDLGVNFVRRFNIPFHFIQDSDHQIAKSYGVLSEDKIVQTLVLIEKGGAIRQSIQGIDIEKKLNQMVRYTFLPWYRKLFKKLF